jgi:hypothetical protein
MINKSASDLLNVMCIQKEAGLEDVWNSVKGVAKNVGSKAGETAKATVGDIKRATGMEKFVPKHDVGGNAIKGALGGAAVGAVGGVATNSGDNKDNFGAAIKGGLMGAAGGAALGGVASKHLNKIDETAFHAQNSAFKRGLGVGSVAGGVAGAVGPDGVKKSVDAVKNSDLGKNVASAAGKAYDAVSDAASKVGPKVNGAYDSAKNTGKGFVDAAKKKVEDLNNRWAGH